MAVTIKELSARCGLSVSTVSKALNDYPDVSEETRKQVRVVADEMGYRANAIARSLKIGRPWRRRKGAALRPKDSRRAGSKGRRHRLFGRAELSRDGARNIRCRSLLLCRRNEAPNKIIRLTALNAAITLTPCAFITL